MNTFSGVARQMKMTPALYIDPRIGRKIAVIYKSLGGSLFQLQ